MELTLLPENCSSPNARIRKTSRLFEDNGYYTLYRRDWPDLKTIALSGYASSTLLPQWLPFNSTQREHWRRLLKKYLVLTIFNFKLICDYTAPFNLIKFSLNYSYLRQFILTFIIWIIKIMFHTTFFSSFKSLSDLDTNLNFE